MDMSQACTPPTSPHNSEADRQHQRFNEYRTYAAAMSRQMVACMPFKGWLAQTEESEKAREIVYQVTATDAALTPGWYKNKFAPKKIMPRTFGPFVTEAEAIQS
jgi:hypothetical protein